jgi:hypothetical protein
MGMPDSCCFLALAPLHRARWVPLPSASPAASFRVVCCGWTRLNQGLQGGDYCDMYVYYVWHEWV